MSAKTLQAKIADAVAQYEISVVSSAFDHAIYEDSETGEEVCVMPDSHDEAYAEFRNGLKKAIKRVIKAHNAGE